MSKYIFLVRNAAPGDFGGGERFPVFVAEQLRVNGYRPILVTRHDKLREFAEDHNITTVRGRWWSHQGWSGWRVLLFPVYIIWQLLLVLWYIRLYRQYQPLAVHLQSRDDFIAGTWAAKLCGVRAIWTDHADLKHIWQNVNVWHKNPVGKLVYQAARHADAITVVSQSERELVLAHLPPNSPVRDTLSVVYNGVVDVYDQYTHATSTDHPLRYCVASRLVRDKGIGEAIDAFHKVAIDHPDSELILLGEGVDEVAFRKQADSDERIVFRGHSKNPLPDIAAAHIFLQPTYHEGFSVALVEASMLGKPIIATAVGGNVEIIHDSKTGLLVPSHDSDALANAMSRLATDPSLRQSLGGAARDQYLEHFEFSAIVRDQFIPLYKEGYR